MQCPLPKLDFDVITLAHGSGGLLTHKLLQSGVFDLFNNAEMAQQHDGAVLQLNGKIAYSTDSYVVSPIFFPGGNIGDLAINGTVNDLAMCGAKAQYLSLSFIIEEGLSVQEFWQILLSIKAAANNADIKIVTGDTKVVEKGKGDKIFINTSGIGIVHPDANIHHNNILEGDIIITSGNIATHGIAIMSVRNGLEFETDIKSDTTALHHCIYELLEKFGTGVKFLRDPTRGGLATLLNEVAELTKLEYYIEQHSIPVEEQVNGACEMLGLDPLYVANEGVFVAIVKKEIATDMVHELRKNDIGKNAAIIGEVRKEHTGKVVLKNSIGGHRILHYLVGEQLPRIC